MAKTGLITHGDIEYVWQPTGDLWQRIDGGDTTTFEYDDLGRLVGVGLPSGDFVEYLYDGLGRRVGRKLNGSFQRGWVYCWTSSG